MKHAILIMAHKNYSFLHHLIEYFERDCYVFVHIDKKSEIAKEEIACLREMPQVTEVYQKYSVHWGGFSILKTQLFLLEQASRISDADYYHVISGQDYPIKPLSTFLGYFERNCGFSFMSYVHLPHPKWQNNTYERFVYYYPYDVIDRNKQTSKKNRVKTVIELQKSWGIRRNIPNQFDHLYGGSQWFSLHKKALEELLANHRKNRRFYNRLRWTFAPEETFFATIIVNRMPLGMVINNNHRFIRWKRENGNIPANLGIEHFYMLATSQEFFARKMEDPYCVELIKLIDTFLLKDTEVTNLPNGGWKYRGIIKYHYSESLATIVFNYAKHLSLCKILDCGCGAGFYVSALRRLGLNVSGFDANPYVGELSSYLIRQGEEPCYMADIAGTISIDQEYEIVLCINVLPFISVQKLPLAIKNLSLLARNSLILGWDESFEYGMEIIKYLNDLGYTSNKYVKKLFEEHSSACSVFYILEKNL